MSDIAISVQNLSKRYRIGKTEAQTTKRRSITRRIASPFYYLYSSLRQPEPDEIIWALKDVSFEVERGEVLGVIGRNGAGKTTLLKILSRITEPTSGRAILNGRVGSLLEVGTGFHPELTGRENIYLSGAILGMMKAEIDRKFDEIVAFSEFEKFLDTPVKRYSSGMRVRLAFAVAAHLDPEILLIDEVLAVGDAAFQQKCLGKMDDVSKQGRTILFVSHNMAAIEHLCTRGIVIQDGSICLIAKIDKAVAYYEKMLFSFFKNSNIQNSDHVIYLKSDETTLSDIEVIRIESLDESNQPNPIIRTWDKVKFRIYYYSSSFINSGSMVIKISNTHQVPILLLSTQPDNSVPLIIRPGYHYVDCTIDKIPLSAGDYIIGSGLAIPQKEWLWWKDELAILRIHARDVYKSGLAPVASRSLLAVQHSWEIHE